MLVEELANLTGKRRNVAEVAELFRMIGQTSADAHSQRLEFALLDGLAQGIRSRGTSLADFAAQPDAAKAGLKAEVERWFAHAAEIAGDAKTDPVLRKEAAHYWPLLLTRLPSRHWSNCSRSRTRICGCWPWRHWRRSAIRRWAGCCWITWRGKLPRCAGRFSTHC